MCIVSILVRIVMDLLMSVWNWMDSMMLCMETFLSAGSTARKTSITQCRAKAEHQLPECGEREDPEHQMRSVDCVWDGGPLPLDASVESLFSAGLKAGCDVLWDLFTTLQKCYSVSKTFTCIYYCI